MANVAALRITFGFSDQADYWKTCLFYLYRPMKTVGANQQEGWTANLRLLSLLQLNATCFDGSCSISCLLSIIISKIIFVLITKK